MPPRTITPPPEPADVEPIVKARFVDVQAVFVPGQGIVRYGDPIDVTAGQLAGDPRFIPWADDWTPDPAAAAASTLEG